MDMIQEVLDGIRIMINKSIDKAGFDKTYTGVILGKNPNNTYLVKINGKLYNYAINVDRSLYINQTVHVLCPQGNMSNGFIL